MADAATGTEVPESNEKSSAVTQAEIDAAHGSTGWNAYEVWRKRVFGVLPDTGRGAAREPGKN